MNPNNIADGWNQIWSKLNLQERQITALAEYLYTYSKEIFVNYR